MAPTCCCRSRGISGHRPSGSSTLPAPKSRTPTKVLPLTNPLPETAAPDLKTRKRALRLTAEALRQELQAAAPNAGAAVATWLLETVRPDAPEIWPAGAVVSTYYQRGSEMDMTVLNQRVLEAGYDLALPVVLGRGHPLAFRRYRPGDRLVKGLLDVLEPDAAAPIVVPRILLLPLLGFDRLGNRLGYGGGYYDRTVALLRREASIQAIGIAFAGQEYAEVPVGSTDAPLDWLITEREAWRCVVP
jgi:5-formyltetrahydrofolate cyclo-ligase